MSSETAGLGVADYLVFVCVIVISIGIGTFHACKGRKDNSSLEYHLGSRKIKTLPLVVSMLVTSQSSILLLGIPAETYLYGGIVLMASFGFCASFLIGTRIIVPMLYPLKLTTVSEFFQVRYKGKAVRLFIATCTLLINEIYIGVIVMAQAVAMEGVTRIPRVVSMLALSSSAVLYTSIGGIKAVIWTDVFQSIIMLIGILSVIIKGTIESGGTAFVWEVNTATDRMNFFNFDPDPLVLHTFWTFVIGGPIKFFFNAITQTSVQRMNSCQTEKQAKLVYLVTGPAFLLTVCFAGSSGLVAYAYFTAKGCDPFTSKQVSNPNQLIPFMVVEMFRDYPGMSGMFLAAVTAATLSTLSSSLAAMSSTTHEDFIKPHFPRLSDAAFTRWSRLSVVIYGIIGIVISFLTAELPGSVYKIAISLMSLFGLPVSGIFLYSIFCPSATQVSVILGGIVSSCLMFWINLGSAFNKKYHTPLQPAPTDQCLNSTLDNTTTPVISDVMKRPEGLDAVYSISYLWLDTVGLASFVLVTGLLSFVTGRPKLNDIDSRCLFSFGERLCPCLPRFIRRVVCCGDRLEKKRENAGCLTETNEMTNGCENTPLGRLLDIKQEC
ncbi:sodium-coupled monocarboxylate transporter 2-like [Ylistrum balloti]|uniref:sodium-coupled monocarboxylate transporter 2-like n=1 Tax=Ylistrum balloti TaxID=509963 RepID=UPI00290596B4|nr:sodium-coupled monocarboxylate transporter 2-like [Ylistrum balloti]